MTASSAWPFGALRQYKYGALLADPPWSYEMFGDGGYAKSPEAHYDTLPDEEIAAFPVHLLAAGDCLLVMWAIWPKLQSALTVMRAWGFAYKTGGSWTKLTKHGKRGFGTGYILRSSTEPFLVGTIGNPTVGSRSERNLIEAPLGKHSEKPLEMREKLLRLRPNSFAAELFAVDPWPGHDTWGLPHRGAGALPRRVPPPAEIAPPPCKAPSLTGI